MSFGEASRVHRVGEGRFEGRVHAGWDIAGKANGGYLLAMAARALAETVERPDPVTLTAHYLAPADTGPVAIRTAVEKAGRRFATARGTVSGADGRPVLAALGTFGDLAGADGPTRIDGAPPALPLPEDCIALEPGDGFPPPFVGKVEMRLHPEDVGFATGESHGRPEMRGWFRLREGERIDPYGLILAMDAFPPTVFNARLPLGWTPTLELTVHVRRPPAPGWLRCAFRSRFISSGFLEADGELWDEEGHLVAEGRQLALVPRGQ